MAKFSKQDKIDIINYYKNGYKTRQISNIYSVAASAIEYVRDQYLIKEKYSLKSTKEKYEVKNKTLDEQLKLLKKENEELKEVTEHQKKFKTFVDLARKKKIT